MSFKGRAQKAGAFGITWDVDHFYVSKEGVSLGWAMSKQGAPCLTGLFSESKPGEFRHGLRWCLKRVVKDFRRLRYNSCICSVDYSNRRFLRLFRWYQRRFGATVVGESDTGVVLLLTVDSLERF